MPKFNVTVEFTQKKTVSVYAPNDEIAQEKAVEMVSKWHNIEEVDAINCELDN